MGILTLETNSSHTSSSLDPAQRKTMSFRDKNEYRVGLGVFDIMLFPVTALGVVGVGPMDTEANRATRQAEAGRCCESHFEDASPLHSNWMIVNTRCCKSFVTALSKHVNCSGEARHRCCC